MKPQQGVECGSWVESPYESALSTSILLDEQLNRRHMTVMRVSGSCRQFLCETVSRLGVATTTHMLKGLAVDPCGYGVSPSPNRACTFRCTRLSILEFLLSFREFAS